MSYARGTPVTERWSRGLIFFIIEAIVKGKVLHPTPLVLHPTPYTLHPAYYTLHPTPLPPTLNAPSSNPRLKA